MAVSVEVGVKVSVAAGVAVSEAVGSGLGDSVGEGTPVAVSLGPGVSLAPGVDVSVGSVVGVSAIVEVGVGVSTGVGLSVTCMSHCLGIGLATGTGTGDTVFFVESPKAIAPGTARGPLEAGADTPFSVDATPDAADPGMKDSRGAKPTKSTLSMEMTTRAFAALVAMSLRTCRREYQRISRTARSDALEVNSAILRPSSVVLMCG